MPPRSPAGAQIAPIQRPPPQLGQLYQRFKPPERSGSSSSLSQPSAFIGGRIAQAAGGIAQIVRLVDRQPTRTGVGKFAVVELLVSTNRLKRSYFGCLSRKVTSFIILFCRARALYAYTGKGDVQKVRLNITVFPLLSNGTLRQNPMFNHPFLPFFSTAVLNSIYPTLLS